MDRCLICDSDTFEYRPYGPGFHSVAKETKIRICMKCALGQAVPLPDATKIEAYYKSDQYQQWHSSEKLLKLESLPNSRALSQYDSLAEYLNFNNIKTVLDYGAGSAPTTRTIKIRHPHITTTVTELSKSLRGLLTTCKEIDAVHETIPAGLPPQDLIILSGVLEHLVDPLGDMKKFRDHLTPGGLLFIEVPNCYYPSYYDVKKAHTPHLFFFMDRTFRSMAWRLGFKLLYTAGLGMSIKEWIATKNMLDIVVRTGLSYARNKHGVYLRALLKKEGD